jgi:hypothetical protein
MPYSLIVAGKVSKPSTRGRIEAIIEKIVSIFPFLLAMEIWPLLHFCKRKSLDSTDHTMLSDRKIIFQTEQRKSTATEFNWEKLRFYKKGNRNLFFSFSLSLSHTQFTLYPSPFLEVGRREFYFNNSTEQKPEVQTHLLPCEILINPCSKIMVINSSNFFQEFTNTKSQNKVQL